MKRGISLMTNNASIIGYLQRCSDCPSNHYTICSCFLIWMNVMWNCALIRVSKHSNLRSCVSRSQQKYYCLICFYQSTWLFQIQWSKIIFSWLASFELDRSIAHSRIWITNFFTWFMIQFFTCLSSCTIPGCVCSLLM